MGVKQWVFQRACNVVFVLFGAWLFFSLLSGNLNNFAAANGLVSGGISQLILALVLLLAALNSVLAGWQIAGDYAHKINVSANVLVAVAAIVSVAFLVIGLGIIF